MRAIGVLVLLAAIGLLGWFARPLLFPEDRPARKGSPALPAAGGSRSVRAAGESASSQPDPGAQAGPQEAPAGEVPAAGGPLCDRLYGAGEGRAIALPDVPMLRRGPAVKTPAWTWVNLWAAWCKPCKEEMPLLSAWARDLRARGAAVRVVFLSLDDDERQLDRYMRGDGAGIEGDFMWAKDEAVRSRFLQAAGLTEPTLPVQVLIDPSGHLRCVRVGSITRRELDEATRVFRW